MLSLLSDSGTSHCDGLNRRDFLRIGSLGMGGLTLPWLLQQQAVAAQAGEFVRDKAVIFLFCCGGPSHIETFAPNMDAPKPWCSVTGEVKTSIPGETFGGTFPKLAALAKRLAIVRSYSPHGISDHAMAIRHVFNAGDPLKTGASMGSLAARLMGSNHPATGLPRYATLIEDENDSQYREDMDRMRASSSPGTLGATCAPFSIAGESELAADMRLNLPLERLGDRRQLLRSLDSLQRQVDARGELAAVDRFGLQAVDVLLGGATRKALDLSQEDPRTVARYDTSRFQTGWLSKRPSTIGKQLLVARRLCEAGAGFVTVGNAGWDNHGNDKHPGVFEGMHLLGEPLDHAVSALLEDIQQRGLSEKILLVITGEFGRAPKIDKGGGRNHWPGLCSLAFAGGGLKMGQFIGKMARTADLPATEPYGLDNMMATIMHTLFDIGQLRINASAPRDLARLVENSKPIGPLF